MHYLTERNERRSRRGAFILAIALHLAFAAALYFYTAQPDGQSAAPATKTASPRPTIPQP